jgi:hypothetical protein
MERTILYAKKAGILGKIVTNYRQERQALIEKNADQFRKILKERAHLIDELRAINQLDQEEEMGQISPIQSLQEKYVEDLIITITTEREKNSGLFPHY